MVFISDIIPYNITGEDLNFMSKSESKLAKFTYNISD